MLQGSEVKTLREWLGLSQAQLARLVDPPMRREDISKLENSYRGRKVGRVMEHRLRQAFAAAEGEKSGYAQVG